jgi:hypothetical protein
MISYQNSLHSLVAFRHHAMHLHTTLDSKSGFQITVLQKNGVQPFRFTTQEIIIGLLLFLHIQRVISFGQHV